MACVAYGCKSHSSEKCDKSRDVSFHRFPQNEDIKNLWIQAVNRDNWKPTKNSRLCSKHFSANCYLQGNKRKMLRTDALPTIFESYPSYLQMEASKRARNRRLYFSRKLQTVQPSTSIEEQKPTLEDSPRKKKLRKILAKQVKMSARRLKKLKSLQQKCRRMKRKIVSLEAVIKNTY